MQGGRDHHGALGHADRDTHARSRCLANRKASMAPDHPHSSSNSRTSSTSGDGLFLSAASSTNHTSRTRLCPIFGACAPDLRIGDVIVWRSGARLLAHRLISKKQTGGSLVLTAKGDFLPSRDRPISEPELLGRVVSVQKGDRELQFDRPCWRLCNWCLAMLSARLRLNDALTVSKVVYSLMRAVIRCVASLRRGRGHE